MKIKTVITTQALVNEIKTKNYRKINDIKLKLETAYELDRQEWQRKSNGMEWEVEIWLVSDKCMKIAM